MAAMAVLMGVTRAIWGAKYRADPVAANSRLCVPGHSGENNDLAFLFWSRNKQIAGFFERSSSHVFPAWVKLATAACAPSGKGWTRYGTSSRFCSSSFLSLGLWIVGRTHHSEIMQCLPSGDGDRRNRSRRWPMPPNLSGAWRSWPQKLEDAVLIMGRALPGPCCSCR